MLPSTLLANTASGSENETESCYAKATDVYNGVVSERLASLLTCAHAHLHTYFIFCLSFHSYIWSFLHQSKYHAVKLDLNAIQILCILNQNLVLHPKTQIFHNTLVSCEYA